MISTYCYFLGPDNVLIIQYTPYCTEDPKVLRCKFDSAKRLLSDLPNVLYAKVRSQDPIYSASVVGRPCVIPLFRHLPLKKRLLCRYQIITLRFCSSATCVLTINLLIRPTRTVWREIYDGSMDWYSFLLCPICLSSTMLSYPATPVRFRFSRSTRSHDYCDEHM